MSDNPILLVQRILGGGKNEKNIWLIVSAIAVITLFAFISSTGTDLFTVLLLIVGAILVFIGLKGRKVEAKIPMYLPILTKEEKAHYLKSGMCLPSEIELFRETMNQTKQQIEHLQKHQPQQ